ncbi:MAG: type II toxin-antitoxin system Phd/YefM family antitoxin [Planctomycetota bacterium]
MKATILDLRRRTKAILKALDHNEPVTITCRGKEKGIIYPTGHAAGTMKVAEHPAFGMWKDRPEYKDVNRAVRRIRKGRTDAL